MVVKKIIESEEGTAFFEFIFFLPLNVLLLGLLISIGNSINGSINQQKITRSYFYNTLKNHSHFPKRSYNPISNQKNWQIFGMYFTGWKDRFDDGERPIQICYKYYLPLGNEEQECLRYSKESSNYIRLGTVYGACGSTFINNTMGSNRGITKSPSIGSDLTLSAKESGCHIIE